MPGIFHRSPTDGDAAVGARKPKSLLNTGLQSIELRTEHALVGRSHEPFSFPSLIGARRKQRLADGRSRSDSRPTMAITAIMRLRRRGLNGPAARWCAAASATIRATAISAIVSSNGQRRRANGIEATLEPTSTTPSTRKKAGAYSFDTPEAKATSSGCGPASFGAIPCQIQMKAIVAERAHGQGPERPALIPVPALSRAASGQSPTPSPIQAGVESQPVDRPPETHQRTS